MVKKQVTLTLSTQPREPGPITPAERQQLADLFLALMDLAPQKKTKQRKVYGADK